MKRFLSLILLATAVAGFGLAQQPKGAQEKPRTMSIDVKDADVRDILGEFKRQCGIRNLIVDRDVQGKGTFMFREVPCAQAFRTIAASLGLGYEIESSYLRVAARK
jgi:type II secretory pathway component HofQ